MSYLSRIYRQRNAHTHDEMKQQPFFSKQHDTDKSNQKSSFFQAKTSINEPGDSYEREADSVANDVVNKSSRMPIIQQKKISSIQRLSTPIEDEKLGTNDARMEKDKEIQEKPIQRMSTEGSDMEKEKMKGIQKMDDPMKEEEKMKMSKAAVQTKQEGGASTTSSQVSSGIKNSSGKGNPLPKKTLHEMNSSFGLNFSNVRVHNDSEAVNMNKDLQAQAFTHGNDIYFNSGKYNPESADGKFLLAHELTHVVQQGAVQEKKIQSKTTHHSRAGALTVKGNIPTNTVHCLKRWTYCSAPYSPGSWGATVSYHCPRFIFPGIILPGTTQNSYVTIPDEFIGTGPGGGRKYRCRHKPKTFTLLTVADVAATTLNRTILYPDFQSCHDGYRSILRATLEGLFSPAGGGPSGIRVNASVPVGGFPC
jgi:hypothetical protein